MIVTHAILEILDIRSGITSIATKELNLGSEITIEYLLQTIKKVYKNTNNKKGFLNRDSIFYNQFIEYKTEKMSFIDFSKNITTSLYNILKDSDDHNSLDILICEFRDDDLTFFGVILLDNKESITHLVQNNDGELENLIIKNFSILPTSSNNLSSYCLINMDSLEVLIKEKPRNINQDEHKVLEEMFCSNLQLSTNEQYKAIKNVTSIVCEEYGINPAIAMSSVKSFLNEKEVIEQLDVKEIAKVAFDNEQAVNDFENKMNVRGLSNNINLDHSYIEKKAISHVIKTDNGIEISIPLEFLKDPNFIEFINEADGTISISVKNINKIINK